MSFQLTIVNPQTPALRADAASVIETAVSRTLLLLAGKTYTLGNGEKNEIHLPHPFVAAEHAQLKVTDRGVTFEDLGSVNGTAVNGHRIPAHEPIRLKEGDIIDIALFQLTLAVLAEPGDQPEISQPPDMPIQPPAPSPADSLPPSPPIPPSTALALPEDGPQFKKQLAEMGLEKDFSRYVQYLPALYDVPFMHRFLALFESLLEPIVWRIDNLDLYLNGATTPEKFLPWLARWYAFTFDHTWTDAQKRRLLQAIPVIFGWWGTARALQTVLDICVGQSVTLIDDERLPPFTFRVEIPLKPDAERREAVERLINAHKPAHTSYELLFTG